MTPTDFVNIASHLPMMARSRPYTAAVIFPEGRGRNGRVSYTHYTFKQLDEESDCIARGLEKIGIRRGIRTVLMVRPCLEFFALTFALFKAGAVPVMIDSGMGVKNLGTCIAEAEPEAFIGIPKAHTARVLLKWGRRTIRICMTVGNHLPWGGMTLKEIKKAGQQGDGAFQTACTRADETAAILFTSGSTGVPKGAVYTHGIFDTQVQLLRQIYGILPGETDLATFPLFALFGPALGMTVIIPDMDATRPAHADPKKIIEAIEDFGATNMFGSPALINRVGRYGAEHGIRLPSLRRVISAGAPANVESLKRFAKMLNPGVQIFTPYGATEALPVCSVGSDEILTETAAATEEGAGACIGHPVEGIELSIIKITDAPIPVWSDDLKVPVGEIGEIVVKGPVVTREYYNRPRSTLLAKIVDPQKGGFYHRMGDLGYVDERGRVWFCGRKSHRVMTAEGTLYTIPVEAVFNTHPAVYRSALVGVAVKGTVRPVLCVELEKNVSSGNPEQIRSELLALGALKPHTRNITTILFHPALPVDTRHNSKIFREKLAVWAKRKLE